MHLKTSPPLALTIVERARIAQQLIHLLEPEDTNVVVAWNEEVRRRVDEIEAGSAELEEWETVLARLEAIGRK